MSKPPVTPEQFFADLELAFRLQFGRDMTVEERKWFASYHRAVKSEEEKRDNDEGDGEAA